MAIADEDVGPAVVVEVNEANSPSEKTRVLAQPGLERLIVESHLAQISVKTGCIAREVCFHQVEVAIAIVVDGRNTHTGLRLAVGTVSHTRFDGDVCESS